MESEDGHMADCSSPPHQSLLFKMSMLSEGGCCGCRVDYTSNLNNPWRHISAVVDYIQHAHPFWNETDGQDHLFWMTQVWVQVKDMAVLILPGLSSGHGDL